MVWAQVRQKESAKFPRGDVFGVSSLGPGGRAPLSIKVHRLIISQVQVGWVQVTSGEEEDCVRERSQPLEDFRGDCLMAAAEEGKDAAHPGDQDDGQRAGSERDPGEANTEFRQERAMLSKHVTGPFFVFFFFFLLFFFFFFCFFFFRVL